MNARCKCPREEPGYRYPRTLVDEVADRIVKDAGGFTPDWRTDPRDTAQAAFDAFLAFVAPDRPSEES